MILRHRFVTIENLIAIVTATTLGTLVAGYATKAARRGLVAASRSGSLKESS